MAASVELLASIGLWFRATRKWALGLVVLLHGFILLSLGPWGHDWNRVVWPWNVVFASMALMVFGMGRPRLMLLARHRYALGVMLLVGVAPLLNAVGQWDHFLSASYYTNLSPEAVFYYHQSDRAQLSSKPGNHQFAVRDSEEEFIVLAAWALETLEVPGYPEERVYRQLGKQLCDCVERPQDAGLHIVRKNRWEYAVEEVQLTCADLQGLR